MNAFVDTIGAIRAPSLHEEVAARLRTMIFERQLGPGAWIDEKALATQWHISRTPVREALKVLMAEGLVSLTPRRGCVVTEVSEDDAERLFPVMAVLEGRCAFEAARQASDAGLAELRSLHDALERWAAAGDVDGYYRANHDFHTRVQALADNPWLTRVTEQLRVFVRLLRGRQLHLPGRLAHSLDEHRALIDALSKRDAERAGTLMHDHLMAQLDALRALRAAEQPRPQPVEAATTPMRRGQTAPRPAASSRS